MERKNDREGDNKNANRSNFMKLIQIVLRFFSWLTAYAMILLRDYASTATVFDFQKTFIAVSHTIGTANRVIIRWANFLTTTE